MKRFVVWITGYPDSRSIVAAVDAREAMRLGAREQQGSHHGEVVQINAGTVGSPPSSHFVRIDRAGKIEFV